jgi:hypothetical protein
MLLPGCGFDVVPSDCLAVHLKGRLPGARRLALALRRPRPPLAGDGHDRDRGARPRGPRAPGRRPDPGALGVEGAPDRLRRGRAHGGDDPARRPLDRVALDRHPDIELYFAASPGLRALAVAGRYLGPAPRVGARVRRFLTARVRSRAAGPTEEERRRGRGVRLGRGRGRRGPAHVSPGSRRPRATRSRAVRGPRRWSSAPSPARRPGRLPDPGEGLRPRPRPRPSTASPARRPLKGVRS